MSARHRVRVLCGFVFRGQQPGGTGSGDGGARFHGAGGQQAPGIKSLIRLEPLANFWLPCTLPESSYNRNRKLPGQRGNLDFFRPVGGYSVGSGLHLWGGGGKLHRDGDQFGQSRSQRSGGGDSQPGACFGSAHGRNTHFLRNIFRQRAGLLHPISLRGLLLPSK